MTVAPIALVAALRETSILFAVLIGWLFFAEKLSRTKALAALVILSGVLVTRLQDKLSEALVGKICCAMPANVR